MLDIIYKDNFLWISYTEKRGDWETSTSIAKAKLNKEKLIFKNIFQANPPIESRYHFGSRLAIKDNYLFASMGERGEGMIAQDASNILEVLLEFIWTELFQRIILNLKGKMIGYLKFIK